MHSNPPPIALVGLMGAGKSSVARLLSGRLGVPVADLDAMLEREHGCSIAEFFDRRGEAEFRRCEAVLLERALASGAGVVACGGGVVLDAGSRATLKDRCRTVWLEVDPVEAARRLAVSRRARPLLAGATPEERLARLLEERVALYSEVARLRVPTGGRNLDEVADAVIQGLKESP